MPSRDLRYAWAEIINPVDYETHMAAIGQAEANAYLIKDLIEAHPLQPTARLLFAGAGTGQMFDYVSPEFLADYQVTFTDIRAEFLEHLRARIDCNALGFETLVDDVECPRVDKADAAALVLVLEHVDWPKALTALTRIGVERFYLIIQVNPAGMQDAVAPTRVLPRSLAQVSQEAKPELLYPDQLEGFMIRLGFSVELRVPIPVADGKTMLGLVFVRREPAQ